MIRYCKSVKASQLCPRKIRLFLGNQTCQINSFEWNKRRKIFLEIFMIFFLLRTAIHNWSGNVSHGLALDVGDFVEIFEENGAWWRGICSRKPRLIGIFPKSYIRLKDSSKEDPVVAECTQVLREWSEIWKKLFVVGYRLPTVSPAEENQYEWLATSFKK